ncbi:MmcQ/YjbR family DNA-binding protein [Phenylobacterium sp.]|uniref:MmcQ/YjbR family DNA-binding protein n=1 Tax=Phenylobacterium sp. TaxID=1871053 RepID=UPI002BDF1761|nr:MmcQ/YjbR family DNA-binding protein [Phenylobacterium sp.]HLZ75781.1 MmcQ/YjbR family DNA-binding protein [Phenylobacterium sp.]
MTSKKIEEARAAILAMPGAEGSVLPSAPRVTLYKVMGKMFAILEDGKTQGVILKCDPHLAEVLREQYASVGHRSHLDRRFWIFVDLGPGSDVPAAETARLIGHSYDLVAAGLTKKQKAELAALAR